MNTTHLDDGDAELYALGALEPEAAARIDRHLAGCGACSHAVGEAERVAAGLGGVTWPAVAAAPTTVALRALPAPWLSRLVAAASVVLALGLGTSLAVVTNHERRLQADDGVALARIARSHFSHATLRASRADAPPVKVLFARDGSWLYVVVDARAAGWHVIGRHGSASRDLGTLAARDTTAALFVAPPDRVDAVEVTDGSGDAIAAGRLAYP